VLAAKEERNISDSGSEIILRLKRLDKQVTYRLDISDCTDEEFAVILNELISQGLTKQIVVLDLLFSNITILPAEIGQLTALRELNLWNNNVSILPAEIGRLSALTRLDLSYNNLTNLPSEIGQLKALTQLCLRYNQLTSLPSEIGQLKKLTDCYIEDNNFKEKPLWLDTLIKRNKGYQSAFKKVLSDNDWESLEQLVNDFLIKGIDSFEKQLRPLLETENPYAEDFQADYFNLLAKQALKKDPNKLTVDLVHLLTDLVGQSAISDDVILMYAIEYLYNLEDDSVPVNCLLLHSINLSPSNSYKETWTKLQFSMLNKHLERDSLIPNLLGDDVKLENQLNTTRVLTLKTLADEIQAFLNQQENSQQEIFLNSFLKYATNVDSETEDNKTIPVGLKSLTPTELFKKKSIRAALNLTGNDTAILLEHVITQPDHFKSLDKPPKESLLTEIISQLEELKSQKSLNESVDENDNNKILGNCHTLAIK